MLTAIHPPAVAAWRGPHDPPGSNFRPAQTFEIYGYWPRAVADDIFDAPIMAPDSAPIFSDPVRARVSRVGDEPVISLIRARLLVDDVAADCGDWTADELRPYLIELKNSVETLLHSLHESARLDAWLRYMNLYP